MAAAAFICAAGIACAFPAAAIAITAPGIHFLIFPACSFIVSSVRSPLEGSAAQGPETKPLEMNG
jgi:hypothetical protein